ncbi:ABC transporter ATP-binding protein [Streptomyces marincola]|uniref:ABC transporter ATP-binding protein n=1 Tax=Streptomyces marincola TaxID=2878388 RepID=UPI001CF47B2A|nr:ABC transporter ATP-binding protein [Streptomyces marincola]UCM91158.1 ABC transporter ATP-binding protein [Streptomyces marincola]
MNAPPVLDVRDLRVDFTDGTRRVRAVRGVDLTLAPGETLGVVGESGSGKSTTALALMRMLPPAGRITGGSIRLDGQDLVTADEDALRRIRGARLAMIFQDPMTALNPVLTIGRHLDEAMRAHGRTDRAGRALELLDLVGIPEPARRIGDHPHQFSGGMRQRVMIALALANEPGVLLADEPTTALDATVQDQILTLLDRVGRETGTALVLITHNMGVVARACRRLLVMYGGQVVESGPTERVLAAPRHPYTAGLLAAVPRLDAPAGSRLHSIPGSPPDLSRPPAGCSFAARCPLAEPRCLDAAPPLTLDEDTGVATACWVTAGAARRPVLDLDLVRAGAQTPAARPAGPGGAPAAPGSAPGAPPAAGEEAGDTALLRVTGLRKTFPRRGRGPGRRGLLALDGVDLALAPGETLGIVGESGSGKSTLARTIVRVHPATSGSVTFRGRDVTTASGAALKAFRREVQMVFQDPYASLNPRMTVGRIIAEPLVAHGLGDREARVAALLAQVGLDPSAADRHPRDFSGGQRQRIGIARALAPEPSVLICDEPVSALDVSVQAQVVNLLTDLQRRLGLAMLFIAHDLAVVRQVSHRIAVMHRGRIVETGTADDICDRPREPYTRALLAAAPVLAPATAEAVAP